MNEHARQKRDLFTPGHYGCPGCGATLAMQQTLSVLGEDTIVVMPAGCWSTLIGIYPYTCLTVPVISVAFGSTAAVAAGVVAYPFLYASAPGTAFWNDGRYGIYFPALVVVLFAASLSMAL